MNAWPYVLLALAAGTTLPLQAAFNARLARHLGSPVAAAAVSGLVLTVVLAVLLATVLRSATRGVDLSGVPWWAWLGGFCGAVVLSASTASAPVLGTMRMIAVIMAGQVACSMVVDHWGLFGIPARPVDVQRAIAAVLLFAGAMLLR